MPKNGRTQAIIRLVVTAVLFINAILTSSGHNPIPLDESTIGQVVSNIAGVVSILWSWWKNNNITDKALRLQKWKEDRDDWQYR